MQSPKKMTVPDKIKTPREPLFQPPPTQPVTQQQPQQKTRDNSQNWLAFSLVMFATLTTMVALLAPIDKEVRAQAFSVVTAVTGGIVGYVAH